MNGSNATGLVKTSVVCYFCNGIFENSQLLHGHLKQCGNILEVCPDKCGAWVERRNLESHRLRCPLQAMLYKSPPSSSSSYSTIGHSEKIHRDNVRHFDKQLDSLRSTLIEEKLQREQLQNQISKLKRQYNLSEERNKILLATLATLRKTLDEESASKSISIERIRQDLEHVKQNTQNFSSFMSQLEMRYDSLQKGIEREQIERSHMELIINAQDGKLRALQGNDTIMESIKNDIATERQIRNEQVLRLEQEKAESVESIKQDFLFCNERIQNIQRSNTEILGKLRLNSDDASKYQLVHFESKSLKAAMEEDSVKIEDLQKTVKELMNLVSVLQRERHPLINNNSIQNVISDFTGHLIWRIDDYENKLRDSIDNESVLLSPLFKTSQYGYTIQAELYLNGLGKWKGRHLTASVFIVCGEHDPLLEWPPTLQANIILKDQATKRNKSVKAIDIVKTLMVKKKENFDTKIIKQETSAFISNGDRRTLDIAASESEKKSLDATIRRQYVFIPHTSLDKFEYIKNNTMFIEIIVSNC